MTPDAFADLESQLANAGDTADPSERAAKLRMLSDRLDELRGYADRLMANANRGREAGAAEQTRRRLGARRDAGLRESLDDPSGVLSHRDLDELAEEGLLDVALADAQDSWPDGLENEVENAAS